MMYPLVLDLAADGVPVAVACRVLGFSKQAFYQWRKDPVSQHDWDDAHLINAALDIHADDPEFGYRFIADELADLGHSAGENRVQRLCSVQGIWSAFAKKRGLSTRPGPPVHDDLVGRDFTASGPNRTWSTDITEHRTDEGKLYLCAIKDLWSNRIVGYSIDDRMTASLACSALRNAIALRSPTGTIVHSDRGSSGQESSVNCCPATGSEAPWAESAHAATTPPWNRGSPCCSAMFWTGNVGPQRKSSGWRSCPGSNAPTTGAAGSGASHA